MTNKAATVPEDNPHPYFTTTLKQEDMLLSAVPGAYNQGYPTLELVES